MKDFSLSEMTRAKETAAGIAFLKILDEFVNENKKKFIFRALFWTYFFSRHIEGKEQYI